MDVCDRGDRRSWRGDIAGLGWAELLSFGWLISVSNTCMSTSGRFALRCVALWEPGRRGVTPCRDTIRYVYGIY